MTAYERYQIELHTLRLIASKRDLTDAGRREYSAQLARVSAAYQAMCAETAPRPVCSVCRVELPKRYGAPALYCSKECKNAAALRRAERRKAR